MLLDVALIVFLYMSMIFVMAVLKKDNSIVDIFWGPGFILISFYSLVQSGEVDLRKLIVTLLVMIWGFRLAIHIFTRNRDKGEDFRYKAWRETWKFFYLRSFFQIFMLQGLFMFIISMPVWYINYYSQGLPGFWDFAGLVLFGIGFYFEMTADAQLTAFRNNPENKGKIITSGLWAISRHPNYFGEALLWWGIGCYALALPDGWWTLAGPLVITLLLRFVSGVPMLEKKYQHHPDWPDYKAKTAPFIPFVKFF